MKLLFKSSIIFIVLAVGIILANVIVINNANMGELMGMQSAYMQSRNLAEGKSCVIDGADSSTAIDGNATTSATATRRNNVNAIIDLGKVKTFNAIIIKEAGLKIKSFEISVSSDNSNYTRVNMGDKIEYHRLITFESTSARYVKITVKESDSEPSFKEIEIYNELPRNKDGFRVTAYLAAGDLDAITRDTTKTLEERRQGIEEYLSIYDWSSITHLFMFVGFSYDINANTYLVSKDENQTHYEESLELLLECVDEFMSPNAVRSYTSGKPLPANEMSIVMSENRQELIKNHIDFANKFGFDGIDIDYEFPQSSYDYEVFGDFLVEIKASMRADMWNTDRAFLSCAFGTRDINYDDEAIEAIDMVNLMTYDIMDQDGHHSSFWGCCVQGGEYLLSVGFTKQQINIGIPFYGTQINGLMEQYIYKATNAHDYYSNIYTFESYYDGSPTSVYFNSPAMVRDKAAFTLLNGYGGVMIFSLTCDVGYDSDFSLMKACEDGINLFTNLKVGGLR